jgi:hypothetical protein
VQDLTTRCFFNGMIEEGPAGLGVEDRLGQDEDSRYGHD